MSASPRRSLIGVRDLVLFGLLTFVPLALGGRGRLNADTKQYLYLDPGGLLDRARSLWDPAVGGGTVTHQTIGYLWPMGPYFWLTDAVGLPDWVAQRLWVGGIQFAAALGVLALLRYLSPRHPAQLVGAAMYGLSPLVLGQITVQSALLLPFAAFGWLVLCVARSVDERGWRWPAVFALIVTTCGSLNGSSVFFVILGSVLWVPFAVWGLKTLPLRDGLWLVGRLGLLTFVTQVWWIAAYVVGGRYGLPILSVTETVPVTSGTTSAAEIVRSLGYWLFYGRDPHAAWFDNLAEPYFETPLLIVVSFLVPVAALALGALVQWTHRTYFAVLVLVGTIIAVGAFPEPRSPVGSAFLAASRRSDLVLSLRNTQRAAPLVALGLCALCAAGLAGLHRRHARTGLAVIATMAVLVAGALPAQWREGLIANRSHRESIPDAWTDAGAYLDTRTGRVLEIPGIDFAAYRWGHTLDPVSVGLTERSVLARELVPMGGTPGVSLVSALDRNLHEGTFESRSLVPVARLLGASDVLVRNDLEYERYRIVRPRQLWPLLTAADAGMGQPVVFNPEYVNRAAPGRPMIDEVEFGLDTSAVTPQLAVFPVIDGGRTALSAMTLDGAVVVEGDGDGVVAAAAAGLLDDLQGPLLLAADVTAEVGRLERSTGSGTRYIVTDSSRKRAERWYSMRENGGATEPADAPVVLDDVSDARIEIVPGIGVESQTVVEWRGADRISATAYGSSYTLLPEERPSNAFDGDPRTAWRVDTDTYRDRTNHLAIELREPVTVDHVTLVPPTGRPGTRAVTRARVVLDDRRSFDLHLDEELARDPAGHTVMLDGQPFQRLEVQILATAPDRGPAGFAEVRIPGVQVDEIVRLPHSLLDELGDSTTDAPIAFVLTRLRAHPAEVVRSDPEPSMQRTFELPAPVSLRLEGTARLRPNAAEGLIDLLLGFPDAASGGWSARSTEHLAGAVQMRAAAAFDGDPTTAWTTPFVGIAGQTLELDAGRDVRFDSLDLEVHADEHHSVPTRITVTVDGALAVVDLPPIASGELGSTQRVTVPLERTLEGRLVTVTVDAAEPRFVPDWYTANPIALPVALAEVHVPGLAPRVLPDQFDSGCRTDLLTVDAQPIGLRVTGTSADALSGRGLDVAVCSGQEHLELTPGIHDLRTAAGMDTAIDLDRLVLTTPQWDHAPTPGVVPPEVTVESASATVTKATVHTDGSPFWLVLDQSMNEGWELRVDGASVEGPRPIDSYASGWLVTPEGPGTLTATARWTTQPAVELAILVSLLGAALCVGLIVMGARRTRPQHVAGAPDGPSETPTFELGLSGLRWIPVPTRAWLVWSAAAGVVTGLVLHPLAAVPGAVAFAVAVRVPLVGRLLPAALVGMAMMQVLGFQMRDRHETSGYWPQHFGGAHVAALLAVIILGLTALWEMQQRSPASTDAADGDSSTGGAAAATTGRPLRGTPPRR